MASSGTNEGPRVVLDTPGANSAHRHPVTSPKDFYAEAIRPLVLTAPTEVLCRGQEDRIRDLWGSAARRNIKRCIVGELHSCEQSADAMLDLVGEPAINDYLARECWSSTWRTATFEEKKRWCLTVCLARMNRSLRIPREVISLGNA